MLEVRRFFCGGWKVGQPHILVVGSRHLTGDDCQKFGSGEVEKMRRISELVLNSKQGRLAADKMAQESRDIEFSVGFDDFCLGSGGVWIRSGDQSTRVYNAFENFSGKRECFSLVQEIAGIAKEKGIGTLNSALDFPGDHYYQIVHGKSSLTAKRLTKEQAIIALRIGESVYQNQHLITSVDELFE